MRRNQSLSACPSRRETIWGFSYMAFELLLLPELLHAMNPWMRLPEAELNFVFFLLNFLALSLILHDYLGRSLQQVWRHPAYFCQAVILGGAAYYACFHAVNYIIDLLAPGYANLNDSSIASMAGSRSFLMAVGTVILVPPAEECLYRGLIFRNLYGKSRWAAYAVSILAFALVHVLGYVGTYSPLHLTMAVLQYLPAGLCLAWAYTKADTVFAPIFIHALVNAISLSKLR
ncbi:MAG: CPBP family intramembrane metalloprotease [Eubacteriales bacterium]|nr:CPBP family intramembrane metalloprotease [Eubacteriales bacterium]